MQSQAEVDDKKNRVVESSPGIHGVSPCLRGKFSGGGGEAVLAGTAQ
jgi:hypothetical protein